MQTQVLYETMENLKGALNHNESLQAKCQLVMDFVDDISLDIQHFIDFGW